jgi:hypothetical protein
MTDLPCIHNVPRSLQRAKNLGCMGLLVTNMRTAARTLNSAITEHESLSFHRQPSQIVYPPTFHVCSPPLIATRS